MLAAEGDVRHHELAGTWPCHGLAASSCDANRKRVASSPNRPRKCTPTGRPSGLHQSGTDIAGFPVMLATTAGYATVLPPTSAARSGSVAVDAISPSNAGGADMVGVSHMSTCVRNSATAR